METNPNITPDGFYAPSSSTYEDCENASTVRAKNARQNSSALRGKKARDMTLALHEETVRRILERKFGFKYPVMISIKKNHMRLECENPLKMDPLKSKTAEELLLLLIHLAKRFNMRLRFL